MDKDYIINRFENLTNYFPKRIKDALKKIPDELKFSAEEIRLRAGRPLAVTICGTQFFILKNGTSIMPAGDMIITQNSEVEETFVNLCNNSVYSHIDEICEGFIKLEGGHRAGICGTVISKDNKITSVRDISSINLRIAKEIGFCSENFFKNFDGGILVCGAPGSGKTTLIREMVRMLSSGKLGKCYKVSVIDSRGEIGCSHKGVPTADLGSSADIFTSCPKGKGIEMALRTMYPDVIVFDELGSMDEVRAIEESMNSGVKIITSAHIGKTADLYKREQTRSLLKSGAIDKIIFCKKDNNFNYKVIDAEAFKRKILCEYQGL